MSFPGLPVFLLPPRPALTDWPLAGASAGLLLALAELLLATPSPPPSTLALLGVISLALGLALAASALGLALRLLGQRPSYSAMVAWVAGLTVLSSVAPLALARAGGSGLLSLTALALALLAATGAAFAAARLADRSERAGTPANAVLCWGATATLVAAGERLLLGERGFDGLAFAGAAGAVLAAAAGACAAFALARRRGAGRPRASFARIFGGLVAIALAAASAPVAIPWLLADRGAPLPGGTPANILVLAFESRSGVADAPGARGEDALAGWTGIRYEPLVAEPERSLEALLTLPDGAALVPELASDGYRTAAILTDPAFGHDVGARELDARPGARALLEGNLRWLAAAPWLAGPGRHALERLGLGGGFRPPAQLASDARSWLLRKGASPIPFFLLVDFRCLSPAGEVGGAGPEESVASLLDHLAQVGLAERTVVLLAQTGGPRERPLRVVVRPPLAWPGVAGSATASRPVQASELGATLRQIARGDGTTPIPFPGVVRIQPAAPVIVAQATEAGAIPLGGRRAGIIR